MKLKQFLFMLLICAVSIHAQQRTEAEATAVTAEQQKAFAEAVAAADKAKANLDTAQLRLEVAQARAQSLLYQIMALLKLRPAEYKAVLSATGELRFEKIQAAETQKKE